MIDFSKAGPQKEPGAMGPVPGNSVVKVKLAIRDGKKTDPNMRGVTIFSTGLKGLDCEYTVVAGQYQGCRIWENVFLPAAVQEIALSSGQAGVCESGMAKMRAMIEASRNIHPDDPAGNRQIEDFVALDGLEFPVKVGFETPTPGDKYVKNKILRIITPADSAEFAHVMGGGEIIGDKEPPKIPDAPAQAGAPPANNWQTRPAQAAASPPAQAQPANAAPAWAQGGSNNDAPAAAAGPPAWAQK